MVPASSAVQTIMAELHLTILAVDALALEEAYVRAILLAQMAQCDSLIQWCPAVPPLTLSRRLPKPIPIYRLARVLPILFQQFTVGNITCSYPFFRKS